MLFPLCHQYGVHESVKWSNNNFTAFSHTFHFAHLWTKNIRYFVQMYAIWNAPLLSVTGCSWCWYQVWCFQINKLTWSNVHTTDSLSLVSVDCFVPLCCLSHSEGCSILYHWWINILRTPLRAAYPRADSTWDPTDAPGWIWETQLSPLKQSLSRGCPTTDVSYHIDINGKTKHTTTIIIWSTTDPAVSV